LCGSQIEKIIQKFGKIILNLVHRSMDTVEFKIKPCVGCGYCCIKTPCGVAQRLHNRGIERCPELHWDGSRYVCQLTTKDGEIGENYRKELYIGAGCCSGLNTWRKDVKPRLGENEPKYININPFFKMFLHHLGGEWISGDKLWLILHAMESSLERDGHKKEEIIQIISQIRYCLSSERSERIDKFMGGMDR
jgi:hypothetical protein